MTVAKNRVVSIDYTLKDDKDQLLDTTSGSEPLEYLHGYGNIIPGLERALEGKSQGDKLSVKVPAADAYGLRDDKLVTTVPLDRFDGADAVEEGMQFEAQTPDGYRVVTVTRVDGTQVTIDGNHALAGLDLNFDVTVAAVREANAEELAHGHVHAHGHHHGHEHENCDGCGGCGGN
ncbi:peptidyl-prolyl cis-trans isomerase [Spirochaetia bacterium]|nr:peptidyl-prolyl cis-trans isomerase [Spirochaetia bacterium]